MEIRKNAGETPAPRKTAFLTKLLAYVAPVRVIARK
jgi:hypothetical protein